MQTALAGRSPWQLDLVAYAAEERRERRFTERIALASILGPRLACIFSRYQRPLGFALYRRDGGRRVIVARRFEVAALLLAAVRLSGRRARLLVHPELA